MKKVPKPRINDNVEMIDFSKTFGRVKKIISNNTLLIDWGEKDIEKVKIRDLALVRRI